MLFNILLGIIEPATFIMIYKRFNGTKDILWKNIFSFIILYASILFKQYFLSNENINIITIIAAIVPIIISFILPKALYQIYNTYTVNKALISFLILSMSVDCIAIIISHMLSIPSNSPIERSFLFMCKVLQFLILRRLLEAIQSQEHEIVYITILSTLTLILNFVLEFILIDRIYKIFGLFINLGLFALILYLLNRMMRKMKKFNMLKGLRHDEQSHYNLIIQMAKENRLEELERYNKNISKTLNSCKHCVCDNFVISSAINDTLDKAIKYNIDFYYKIETSCLPINAFEQNVILRNILNNAIEACKNFSGDRKIYFTITTNQYNEPKIKCVNSSSKKRINRKTSKKDKLNHGYGLENIKHIIDKKHGMFYCKYSNENQSFLTLITFKS